MPATARRAPGLSVPVAARARSQGTLLTPPDTKKPWLDGGDQPGPLWCGARRAVASRRKAPWGFSRTIVPMGYG
ncbi:hypothetical protein GCM10010431_54520 [Streptomyces kunmingensis]